MTYITAQLKEVKDLVQQRVKHQPGRHDQGKHAGTSGGYVSAVYEPSTTAVMDYADNILPAREA